MRRIIISALALLVTACTGKTGLYERTIENYIRHKTPTTADFGFKALSTEKTGEVTVADSVATLTTQFEEQHRKDIRFAESTLEAMRSLSQIENNNRYVSQADRDKTAADIRQQESRIDSLRTLRPAAGYEGRPGDEVLAIIVRCHYALTEPNTKLRKDETSEFYLSADGKMCFGYKRVQ